MFYAQVIGHRVETGLYLLFYVTLIGIGVVHTQVCIPLPEVTNGKVEYSGITNGSVARLTCNTGFEINGNNQSLCLPPHWSSLGTCDAKQNALQLVGGPSSLKGRIEVDLFGRRWTICALGIDYKLGTVACRSLGYSGFDILSYYPKYGAGDLPLYKRNISCSGKELSLEHCNHSDTEIDACGRNNVVCVSCRGSNLKLELFNKSRPYEGLLTAYRYYDGQWYDIVKDVYGNTARTLCFMLGFGWVGFSTISRNGKNVSYYNTDIFCQGTETYVDECSGDWQHCAFREDNNCFKNSQQNGLLALFCSDYEIQSIAVVSEVVELTVNNENWSICDNYYTDVNVKSICRILGYTGITYYSTRLVNDSDHSVIGDLMCKQGASTLSDCKLRHKFSYRPYETGPACSHKVHVKCSKECRQGYFGPDCSKCICNFENTQSCDNNTGECACKEGWTGKTCSDDTNECQTTPGICAVPLECLNTVGSYSCICPFGMIMKDQQCEECKNNTYGFNCLSTCSCNTQNTYMTNQICNRKTGQCFCKPEWTGHACNSYKKESREDVLVKVIAIASSVAGVIVIVIIVAVVLCRVRRQRGKPHVEAKQEEQHHSPSGIIHSGDARGIFVLSKTGNRPHQKVDNEDDDSSKGYIELSQHVRNIYDVPTEDMGSDGYINPTSNSQVAKD